MELQKFIASSSELLQGFTHHSRLMAEMGVVLMEHGRAAMTKQCGYGGIGNAVGKG